MFLPVLFRTHASGRQHGYSSQALSIRLLLSAFLFAILNYSKPALAEELAEQHMRLQSCQGSKPYSSDLAFAMGSIVKKDGKYFQCIQEDECHSISTSLYEPGTGEYWRSAWQPVLCMTEVPPSNRAT